MFRTSPGPSSEGIAVFMRHWYFVILYSWLSGVHTRQLAIQNIVHQVGFIYKII